MFYVASGPTPSGVSFADFIDFYRSMLPIDSDSKIEACVGLLQSMSVNTEEILHILFKKYMIERSASFQSQLASNTFAIFQDGDQMVRLNLWSPASANSLSEKYNARMYAYGYAHDHNFDLLTVGGYGSGYRTRIFEYDVEGETISADSALTIESKGTFNLGRGDVLFYEQNKDIHIQEPSNDLSVSLNIITKSRVAARGGQFVFDDEVKSVVGMTEHAEAKKIRLCEILLELNPDKNIDAAVELAGSTADPYVRARMAELIILKSNMSLDELCAMSVFQDLTRSVSKPDRLERQFAFVRPR